MPILDLIKKRREITKFKDKKIPDDVLEQVIDAAYYVPSGNNLISR